MEEVGCDPRQTHGIKKQARVLITSQALTPPRAPRTCFGENEVTPGINKTGGEDETSHDTGGGT